MTAAEIRAQLKASGAPVVDDRILGLFRTECPVCRAGERDPDRIYLPLSVIDGRRDAARMICDTGCSAEHIAPAFTETGR